MRSIDRSHQPGRLQVRATSVLHAVVVEVVITGPQHILRLHVGALACAPQGTVAVPPVADGAKPADQLDIGRERVGQVLLLQPSDQRATGLKLLQPRQLLLRVGHLLPAGHLHQRVRRSALVRYHGAAFLHHAAAVLHQSLQPALLVGEDGVLEVRKVHLPAAPDGHVLQDVLDLGQRVVVHQGHWQQLVYHHLGRVPRLADHREQRLPRLVLDHEADFCVRVHVLAAPAAAQAAALVHRAVLREELQAPRGLGVLQVRREQEVLQLRPGHARGRRWHRA
mmetsp:Transcript_125814/g.341614  ORF Transcript_125814/g.341614 Transcript_125814/m.341614 type:complete len:280 (+) Transcript_125814:114-953(+)